MAPQGQDSPLVFSMCRVPFSIVPASRGSGWIPVAEQKIQDSRPDPSALSAPVKPGRMRFQDAEGIMASLCSEGRATLIK